MPFRLPSRFPAGSAFWAAQCGFWLAMFAVATIVIRAFKPALVNPEGFIAWRIGAAFVVSSLLRTLTRRSDWLDRLGISRIGLMVGGPLMGAMLLTLGFTVADIWTGTFAMSGNAFDAPPDKLSVAARFLIHLGMLSSWSAAYFGSHLLRDQRLTEMRALEAEALAARNELEHLHAQISPHFLFNALNTVLACKQSPDDIETIVHSLAKYLRFLLRPVATLEPIGREIDALEDYLTIQSFRFGDRLACRIDCDTTIRGIPVLPVMIQPLVENALKYGTAPEGRPLEVQVRAWREGRKLLVEVANTGRWQTAPGSGSTRTGLHALRRRLLIHGGPEATVSTTGEDGWVRVLIQIPLAREYALDHAQAEAGG